jgi:hypothetical protein
LFDWTQAFGIGGKIILAIRALLAGQPVNESFPVSVSGKKFTVQILIAPQVNLRAPGAVPTLLLQVHSE